MTAQPIGLEQAQFKQLPAHKGPVTAARQRRTKLIYAGFCALGLLPILAGASASLQAAGIGLWLPGAGFVAVGGWATLLFPLTLALFIVSLVAWFWAGMVLAPVAVWLGSAVLAAAMAGETIWAGSPYVAALAVAGIGYGFHRRNVRLRDTAIAKIAPRAAFIDQSLAEVRSEAANVPDPDTREMTPTDLSALRYLLDRALQPVGEWGGFDIIDQFQPAALRYQINHMGFALGVAQRAYVPAFRGYMGEAQRNLIEKYLQRKVWGYWVYESCWGHLNFSNWDPAARDNIMLTGWFGMHVGQYMLASGDRRYLEPGSLTFRLNASTAYVHDFNSIIGSVKSNYDIAEFGLFACEPNWIYPICNHYGMASLAVQDAVTGTDNIVRYLPNWFAMLEQEFTDESGSIIGLRSQHTGMPIPFPTGEAGYAPFENCFAPDRAQKLWAIARREIAPAIHPDANGKLRISLPGKGLDTGNYKSGHTGSYAAILVAAREFGDDLIAEAAQNSLDSDCGLEIRDGVRRYTGGSNDTNSYAVLGQLIRTGDFRRSFTEGPSPAALAGPVLEHATYPAVLVAQAISDGNDLRLVLYPGSGAGMQNIGLGQLEPGRSYWVKGATVPTIVASQDGTARLDVLLDGRTEISLEAA
jgi:Linalool dehydratase/isomerase